MLQQVAAHHLSRLACLYVRQSTLQQVVENTESTSRQYALRERARALGWPDERILVIDQDLGQSGASTADRLGFQRLVAHPGWARTGRIGVGVGSLPARPQFQRLASAARNLCPHPYVDP